jgi:integral membrane protein (TIGR01906 family)
VLAVVPLLSSWFIHPALDAAGSAERLGVSAAQAHALSDRSVEELLLGPGSFDISGPDGQPFYDAAERSHLADARTLLIIVILAGSLGILLIAALLLRGPAPRAAIWRTVARAGRATAAAVVILGVVSLVAFDVLFRLFHRIFFPGGNWSFDPDSQRLVQLYPFAFWQIAAGALAVMVLLLAIGAWWLGGWAERRSMSGPSLDTSLDSIAGTTHPAAED